MKSMSISTHGEVAAIATADLPDWQRDLFPGITKMDAFHGIPLLRSATDATHPDPLARIDEARRLIDLAEREGIEAALVPAGVEGLARKQISSRVRRFREAGEVFWNTVRKLGLDEGKARDSVCLDVGCGFGFDMAALCRRFRHVVGIDPQIDRCVMARRYLESLGHRNFFIICARAEHLRLGAGCFDVVTANQSIEHLANRRRAFHAIVRLLKPGGRFVFALPTRYSLRPEPHAHLMFLGWMPRAAQNLYASLFAGDKNYASYTNLVSHRRLCRELKSVFRKNPALYSGLEVYTPMRTAARLAAGIARPLLRTPLRSLLVELGGDVVGSVEK